MRECVVLAETDQLDDVTSSMMEYVTVYTVSEVRHAKRNLSKCSQGVCGLIIT
jgi:hypothetical protein